MNSYQVKTVDDLKREMTEIDEEIVKINMEVCKKQELEEGKRTVHYNQCFAIVKSSGYQCSVKTRMNYCKRHDKMSIKEDIRIKVENSKKIKNEDYWIKIRYNTVSKKYKKKFSVLVKDRENLKKKIDELVQKQLDDRIQKSLERSREIMRLYDEISINYVNPVKVEDLDDFLDNLHCEA